MASLCAFVPVRRPEVAIGPAVAKQHIHDCQDRVGDGERRLVAADPACQVLILRAFSVRPAAFAASVNAARSHLFPCPVRPLFSLPALSVIAGADPRRRDVRDLRSGEARGSALLLAAAGGCGHPGRGDRVRRHADDEAPSDDGQREEGGVRADEHLLGRAQKERREVARRLAATGTCRRRPAVAPRQAPRPRGRCAGSSRKSTDRGLFDPREHRFRVA